MQHTPIAAGGSSFDLIDVQKLFAEIEWRQGITFVDVACGYGYYSIAASKYIGDNGVVYAIDLWPDGIDHLSQYIKAQHIYNIQAVLADARNMIPLKSSSIDVCLLATVLHDFIQENTEAGVLEEIHRILKPGGRFLVIEFKKIASKPGPPVEIRLLPEQVESIVTPYGFRSVKTTGIGAFNYLSLFANNKD